MSFKVIGVHGNIVPYLLVVGAGPPTTHLFVYLVLGRIDVKGHCLRP